MHATLDYATKPSDHLSFQPMIARNVARNHCDPFEEDADAGVPTVFVVDPDPSTSIVVNGLLEGYQFKVQAYASSRDFFAAYDGSQPGCLVLEQRIFDASGLQVQRRLAERNLGLPMVYVTSNIDVSTAVVLMRGGAVHVLEKPLRSMELLEAIQEALARGEIQQKQDQENRYLRESVMSLTRKERQLVGLLSAAKSTKAISTELSICPRAVELRRRGIMKKLGMDSPLELVRFAVLAYQEFSSLLESEVVEVGAD
jgi:FixJ family two-component response regulator